MKCLMHDRFKKAIASSGDRPKLFMYAADGTPATTTVTTTAMATETRLVVRKGKKLKEYYLEKAFLVTDDVVGTTRVNYLFRDARCLESKGHWSLYTAAVEFACLLRELGARGICVQGHCVDGAAWGVVEKIELRTEKYYRDKDPTWTDPVVFMDWLLDWFLKFRCCLHLGQLALKRAVRNHFPDQKKDFKDLYVGTAAIRNAYDVIVGHLKPWLRSRLKFTASVIALEIDYMFWKCVGVDEDVINVIIKLQLRFEGGCVWVHERSQASFELTLSKVHGIYLYMLRVIKFTDSRFLSMGHSMLFAFRDWSLGVPDLIDYTRADPKASDYYIKGYSRIHEDLRIDRT